MLIALQLDDSPERYHCQNKAINTSVIMKIRPIQLTGWMRLYFAFSVVWLIFTAFSLHASLPSSDDLPSAEQLARSELKREVERIGSIQDPAERLPLIVDICKKAHEKTAISKGECMAFVIKPEAFGMASQAIMMSHIISPKLEERTSKIRSTQEDELRPVIKDVVTNHLKQAFVLPLLILVLGNTIAWIRRGFKQA
jgi:hypothetical protein